jgi:hydroxymethylpyrimidine kinase/phosphomethylpyrimidine kinase
MMAGSKKPIRVALTIAGFDPSGGAGVLADTRTFAAFGFTAAAAVTSLTFQSHREFFGAVHQTAETIRAQLEPLLESNSIACAKTGMLPTREIVSEVARLFRKGELPAPVVDPVLMSSSKNRLMEEDAIEVLVSELFPVCRLVTPNIPEAEKLTGLRITSEADMRQAAAKIRQLGARAVLVKGGHLRQKAGGRQQAAGHQEAVGRQQEAGGGNYTTLSTDVLDDDGKVTAFSEKRVEGVELHGSGCILSAAIAAGLGKGMTLEESVASAKSFVSVEFRKQLISAGD